MSTTTPIRVRTIYRAWWPLATSWLLMGLELPIISAVMARLPESTISLAAYGGVVFPLALLIESPVIMLLAASTALSKDWQAYALVRRFMWLSGWALTAIHVAIAFTPLFDLLVVSTLGVPAEIVDPARLGMQIMTPWSLAIAYRRFQQGLLIRNGRTKEIGIGTAVRLSGNVAALTVGWLLGSVPGIAVGCAAMAVGVVTEAIYIGIRVHPLLRDHVRHLQPTGESLTWRRFGRFYLPLSITPSIMFLALPMSAAAMSRMPGALDSLAAWPVWNGLVFALRSLGFAYNEVVVAFLEKPGSLAPLRTFARRLALVTAGVLALVGLTPLGPVYFRGVTGVSPELANMANTAVILTILMPALSALQSFYQGTIVHSHKTRGITEAMVLYLATMGGLFVIGVAWNEILGLYYAVSAAVIGNVVQTLWMRYRARGTLGELASRDHAATRPVETLSPAAG